MSDCRKVEKQRDALAEEFNAALDVYEPAKAAVDAVVDRMIDCNLDIERVNSTGSDLQDWSRQVPPLEAPSTWCDTKEQRRWGPPRITNGGLVVAMAQSMVPPTYSPADWSKPEYQAARRAEADKRQREMSDFYTEQTVQQDSRQNLEEAQRFAQAHRHRLRCPW